MCGNSRSSCSFTRLLIQDGKDWQRHWKTVVTSGDGLMIPALVLLDNAGEPLFKTRNLLPCLVRKVEVSYDQSTVSNLAHSSVLNLRN